MRLGQRCRAGSPLRPELLPLCAALALVSTSAWSQTAVAGRGFTFTPTLSLSQVLTDNRNLDSVGKSSEAITQISPGLRLSSRSGRVQGTLDYSLNALVYARGSGSNAIQHALNSSAAAELVENRVFVDGRATISQQTISAFGAQSGQNNAAVNANRSEVVTLGLSPSVRGRLAGVVDYEARLSYAGTRSGSTQAADSSNLSGLVRLSGGRGQFGWSADASRQVSDFNAGRRTEQDRIGAGATYRPDPELRFSARLAQESTDVISSERRDTTSWGWGVDWTPSQRTLVGLQSDRRYFGNSHGLTLQHRLARSIWRYTDSRNASSSTGVAGAPLTQYDLFFVQFASLEPDPTRREQLVRSFLLSNGLDANATVSGGFLSSALSVQRSQNLSMALTGQRQTVTLAAFRTATRRLDSISGVSDDLSQVDSLQQTGYSLSLAHRLTPTSSISLLASNQKTTGRGGSNPAGNEQRSLNLAWSSQIAARANLTVGARHIEFDSATKPYNESALTATLSLRF
ncbi:MAG: TIGR03016 family PEP-CTERM system-associated outer membrane protein [Rubrivivax sp.]|nr:TIGR03016 family PEP-CTERM system-associated outer membrane protein [Rubrivivax sp.]